MRRSVLTAGSTVAACAAVAAAVSVLDAGLYPRLGLPVPDLAPRALLAALRTVAELGGGVCVGSLLFAAFVAAPQRSGVLDLDGYLAVRRAGWAGALAGVAALLLAPMLAADLTGASVTRVLDGDWWSVFAALEEPMGWLVCGLGSLFIAAGVR